METDLEAVKRRVAGVERRYRFSSAIGNVVGIADRDYGAVMSLVHCLRADPLDAVRLGISHWSESAEGRIKRADEIEAVLAVLAEVEHDADPELLKAMAFYAQAVRPDVCS